MGPAPATPHAHRHETFHHAPHPVTATNESSLAKGPLDGVTVLDFASYIAGSYGPMILAQLGANVIKIENLEGDAFRSFGFGFLGWNQGKRGLAIDLNSREGLDIVYRLAEEADVLVENLRPGRMKRFGLDYDTLAKANPGLIYMSVNAFGNIGPDHNQPGIRSAAASALGRDGGAGRTASSSGLSHLRDLRLRRRDAVGVRMHPGLARAAENRPRAILLDDVAASVDGVSGGRVHFL